MTPSNIVPSIVPAMRPEIGRHAAEEMLHAAGVDIAKPALLGRRAYYRDTMGTPGANDIGIYDDAIILVSPTAYATFNANTDPSRHRPAIATLKTGVWRYKLGTHNQSKDPALHPRYEALVQADQVTVLREGGGEDTGWFGINIHRGSFNSTSSEGCQTIYPAQWDAYIALVKSEMVRHGLLWIPYCLTEREPTS